MNGPASRRGFLRGLTVASAATATGALALPLAAAAFEVIGSIGPWAKASVGGLTESGIHGGGKATLALAAIIPKESRWETL